VLTFRTCLGARVQTLLRTHNQRAGLELMDVMAMHQVRDARAWSHLTHPSCVHPLASAQSAPPCGPEPFELNPNNALRCSSNMHPRRARERGTCLSTIGHVSLLSRVKVPCLTRTVIRGVHCAPFAYARMTGLYV